MRAAAFQVIDLNTNAVIATVPVGPPPLTVAEVTMRRNLVQRGYLKGMIGLPPNLFYGTGIPACIIVLNMEDVVPANTFA